MYHPIQLNPFWQEAARKLNADGFQFHPLDNGIVPGYFAKDCNLVYLVADQVKRGAQKWTPVDLAELPEWFNAEGASRHTGMAAITIKGAIMGEAIQSHRFGKRARFVPSESLLRWMKHRPVRGVPGERYRTRKGMEKLARTCLLSTLRAAVRSQRVNFEKLFDKLSANVEDPEKLLLSNVDQFMETLDSLSADALMDVLEAEWQTA